MLELHEVDREATPSAKLRALLMSARTIYNTVRVPPTHTHNQCDYSQHVSVCSFVCSGVQYTLECMRRQKHEGGTADRRDVPALGLDGFFPVSVLCVLVACAHSAIVCFDVSAQIFVFVLVRAQLANPLHLKHLLSTMVHPLLMQVRCYRVCVCCASRMRITARLSARVCAGRREVLRHCAGGCD